MITRVLAAGSNSTSSRLARKAGVMRAGKPVSRWGMTATNSSFSIGVVTNARRCTGRVTSAMSIVLPSTALTKSAVLPVLTSTLRLGKRTRKERRMCGSKYRQAVAPVPSVTRPVTLAECAAMAVITPSTAESTCRICSSKSMPAGVGAARRATRSIRRTRRRCSSWRICRLTAGCDKPSLSAAPEKLPVSMMSA
jgi:hypothetical protein